MLDDDVGLGFYVGELFLVVGEDRAGEAQLLDFGGFLFLGADRLG